MIKPMACIQMFCICYLLPLLIVQASAQQSKEISLLPTSYVTCIDDYLNIPFVL